MLFLINSGMLFYILLFGISRDGHHQQAWATSFAIWLVMEIAMVSSVMVLVMNVLIPMILMKDVRQIKRKLIDTIVQYHHKLHQTRDDTLDTSSVSGSGVSKSFSKQGVQQQVHANWFNAAQYLFVSYRLAKEFPELRVSKFVLAYETPWPRQSYLHTSKGITQSYDRRFGAISQALVTIAISLVSNFVTIPIPLQDLIMQLISTVVLGYTILVHVQLYQIYPVLIAVPTLLIAAILHFIVKSTIAQETIELAQLLNKVPPNDNNPQSKVTRVVDQLPYVEERLADKAVSEQIQSNNESELISNGSSTPKHVIFKDRRQSIQLGFKLLQQGHDQLAENKPCKLSSGASSSSSTAEEKRDSQISEQQPTTRNLESSDLQDTLTSSQSNIDSKSMISWRNEPPLDIHNDSFSDDNKSDTCSSQSLDSLSSFESSDISHESYQLSTNSDGDHGK
jgi:hypothetical protein